MARSVLLCAVALCLVGCEAQEVQRRYWFRAVESYQQSRGKELGNEEYTMKGSLRTTESFRDLGCVQCNSGTHCTKTGNWAVSPSIYTTRTGPLTLVVTFDAWEDDVPGRCTFDSAFFDSDDARVRETCSFDMTANSASNQVSRYTCNGGNARLVVEYSWKDVTTPAPPTPSPPTPAPPTPSPPTPSPPTPSPPTSAPPTSSPPTSSPPTPAPPTAEPTSGPCCAALPVCWDGFSEVADSECGFNSKGEATCTTETLCCKSIRCKRSKKQRGARNFVKSKYNAHSRTKSLKKKGTVSANTHTRSKG